MVFISKIDSKAFLFAEGVSYRHFLVFVPVDILLNHLSNCQNYYRIDIEAGLFFFHFKSLAVSYVLGPTLLLSHQVHP